MCMIYRLNEWGNETAFPALKGTERKSRFVEENLQPTRLASQTKSPW